MKSKFIYASVLVCGIILLTAAPGCTLLGIGAEKAEGDGTTRRPSGPALPDEAPPAVNIGSNPAQESQSRTSSDNSLARDIRHQQMQIAANLPAPGRSDDAGTMKDIGAMVVLGGGRPNSFYREQVMNGDQPVLENGQPKFEHPYFMAVQVISSQPIPDFRDVWSMSTVDASMRIRHLGDKDSNGRDAVQLIKATIPENMIPPDLRPSAGVHGADTWWIMPITPWQLAQINRGNRQRISPVNELGVHFPVTELTGREDSNVVFINDTNDEIAIDIFNHRGVAAGDAGENPRGPWNLGVYNPNLNAREFRGVMPDEEHHE